MNQNERRGVWIAGFLVMNANSIYVDELRVIGMKNNVTALVPIGIAGSE